MNSHRFLESSYNNKIMRSVRKVPQSYISGIESVYVGSWQKRICITPIISHHTQWPDCRFSFWIVFSAEGLTCVGDCPCALVPAGRYTKPDLFEESEICCSRSGVPRSIGLPPGHGSARGRVAAPALTNHGVLHVRRGQGTEKNQPGNRAANPQGQAGCTERTQASSTRWVCLFVLDSL